MRHGGKLLVDCLEVLGATRGYGVPGESYLTVLDGMYQSGMTFVNCRNEGGAGFMAAAHGKLTGEPGLCFVTRGPGATNASIGVHTAMQDSAPMILFVGQIDTKTRDREMFQEVNYRAFFGDMAKWVTEIEDVERIPEIVSRAWATALSGRPGPVVVALPEDVVSAETETEPFSSGPALPVPTAPPDVLEGIRAAINLSKRPVILAGGGGWTDEGRRALEGFAQQANIPVVAAFRYQDVFDNNVPTYAGEAGVGILPGVRETLAKSDLILAINIRFGEMTTDNHSIFDLPEMRQTLIHSHASARELGKIYQPDIAVQSCPNRFAMALEDQVISGGWAKWTAEARGRYEAGFDLPELPGPVRMADVMAYLRGRLEDDAILTNGAGNFSIWNNKYFRYGRDQRLLAPQSGAMGYGVPAAVMAKGLFPERQVVCFAGDGDFQMNGQELATAMQMGVGPVVLILNNGTYGTIRMHQERHFPNRVSGTDLENPDFVALARAYGMLGEKIERTEDFAPAFERALSHRAGAVLEITIATEALAPRLTVADLHAGPKT